MLWTHVNLNLICCIIVEFCCILFPHFCGLFRRPLPDRPPPRLPDRPLVPGGKPDLTGNRQNGPGQSLIWGLIYWIGGHSSCLYHHPSITSTTSAAAEYLVNQPDTGSKIWNIKSDSQWASQIHRAVRSLIVDWGSKRVLVHSCSQFNRHFCTSRSLTF